MGRAYGRLVAEGFDAIVDDEAEVSEEERRLRRVRQQRHSLRQRNLRRGETFKAAMAVAMQLSGVYAVLLGLPGNAVLIGIGIVLIVVGTWLLNRWRRRTTLPA
jgi:hypothetical protein